MLKLSVVKTILLGTLLSTPTYADELSVGVLFGGHSSHMTSDADWYKFNESHNMFGVILDDKFILATLENSYYRRSNLVAYNHTFWNESVLGVDLSTSVSVGLITGYHDRNEMGAMYLGNHVSAHIMPTLKVSYKVSDNLKIGFNQSLLPADHGVIYFNNFVVEF